MAHGNAMSEDEKDRKINDVLLSISRGKTITKACELAGISKKTWYVWIKADAKLNTLLEDAQENGNFFEMETVNSIKQMVEEEILSERNVKMGMEYLKARDERFQKKGEAKATLQIDMADIIRMVNGMPSEKGRLPERTVINYEDIITDNETIDDTETE